MNYPASSSLSQSQLQEKQYEYYKQQEPTITINSPPNTVVPPTSVPITHPLAVQETSVETKKTEEKSSCTVMWILPFPLKCIIQFITIILKFKY